MMNEHPAVTVQPDLGDIANSGNHGYPLLALIKLNDENITSLHIIYHPNIWGYKTHISFSLDGETWNLDYEPAIHVRQEYYTFVNIPTNSKYAMISSHGENVYQTSIKSITAGTSSSLLTPFMYTDINRNILVYNDISYSILPNGDICSNIFQ